MKIEIVTFFLQPPPTKPVSESLNNRYRGSVNFLFERSRNMKKKNLFLILFLYGGISVDQSYFGMLMSVQ